MDQVSSVLVLLLIPVFLGCLVHVHILLFGYGLLVACVILMSPDVFP